MKETFQIIKKSVVNLCKNPILILPSLIILIMFFLISKTSVRINSYLSLNNLNNAVFSTSWLALFVLISLLIISFLFSGLIGASSVTLKRKATLKDLFVFGKKYWLKNFVAIFLILIISDLVFFASLYSSFYIGKTVNLSLRPAQALFFLALFIGMALVVIFFTYSSFFLIIKNLSIRNSIKSSFRFVKSNYIHTLALLLIFFVVDWFLEFLEFIHPYLSEIVTSLILVPLLALALSITLIDHKI